MKILHLLFIFGFYPAFAFTKVQQQIIRKQLADHNGPPLSAIVDAVLAKDYAFSDQQRLLCHIDAARFQCCPNSFSSVIAHEIHHLNQRQHTIGIKDDPMSYVLTVSQNGSVVEDKFVLPPLSPSQPWAAQILAPRVFGVPVLQSPASAHSYLPERVVMDQPKVIPTVTKRPNKMPKTMTPTTNPR